MDVRWSRGALRVLVSAVVAVGLPGMAQAGLVNDVASCYAATHIAPPAKPYDATIFVLIDQTVQLDPTLEQSVVDNVHRLLQPGTRFVVAEFSAFSQGRYLSVLHTGVIEKPLAAGRIDDTPIVAAANLKKCLGMQRSYAENLGLGAIATALKGSTSSLDQSDIMQALKSLAPAIQGDPASEKTLFLVSDGLENSGITSFYGRGTVRLINPTAELAKAKAAGMVGDFGGARVFVLGGAMMPPLAKGTRAQRDGYRAPQVLNALAEFWRAYFNSGHADLVEFGEPALVSPVSFPAGN